LLILAFICFFIDINFHPNHNNKSNNKKKNLFAISISIFIMFIARRISSILARSASASKPSASGASVPTAKLNVLSHTSAMSLIRSRTTVNTISSPTRSMSCCHWFEPTDGGDTVWQIDANRVKFGHGALEEIGNDMHKVFNAKRVALFTDPFLSRDSVAGEHVQRVVKSLKASGVEVEIYDEIEVEPTDASFKKAAMFAAEHDFDAYVSVGGGSVMDTAKAASLYSQYPPAGARHPETGRLTDMSEEAFLTYVNAPVGGGVPVPGNLKPHIAVPTTAGTGSECTGIAIFDLLSMRVKTGMQSHKLKPDLAVIDPTVTHTMTSTMAVASGFDVCSHAVESFTARPFTRRRPVQTDSSLRPPSQGSNPYSDLGCREALRLCGLYLARAQDPTDLEAREQMMMASFHAGVSFGNCGCHIPHAMSYPVSGHVRSFRPLDYPGTEPIVPHGMSVILNAPAVFRWTADACPDRHLEAASLLGGDIRGATDADAGQIIGDTLIGLLQRVGFPNGLNEVGYNASDSSMLADGAMPQRRLMDNAPKDASHTDIKGIYEDAMKYWN
jgi:hydroxyacid-oxoacid transhydrogenase